MKRHILIYLALLAAVALPSTVVAEPEARAVSWGDLKPVIEFEAPFEELSTTQLMDLSILALVQEHEKQGPGAVDEGMRQKAKEARGRLEEQKVDIDRLFAKRKEITELRTKQATATVPSLDGILVTLHGFVLTKHLYLLDGAAQIPMSYSMNSARVGKYKDGAKEPTTDS